MLIYTSKTGLIPLFYFSILQANPTHKLEKRLQEMALPIPPSWEGSGEHISEGILYGYPYVIDYLQNSVRSRQHEPYLLFC